MSRTKRDPETGCLVWTWTTNRDGYGRFYTDGFDWKAHRWIFREKFGYLPEEVMHSCDNPPCVDWERCLKPGNHAMNTADRVAKGRTVGAHPGERHHNCVLTDLEVAEIRKLYKSGAISQRVLAERYGVDRSTISLLINNRRRAKHS